MTNSIQAEHRQHGTTRGELRKLREEGKVPGVLYGKNVDNSPILVDEKELMALLRGNDHAVVHMKLEGEAEVPVMVEEVQRHSLNREILHVDFRQINMREPIRADVRVEFSGRPKGESKDYLLQVQKHDIEVRCLPDRLPALIEADISHLEIGNGLTAGELHMPEGVEMLTEPSEVIAVILAVKTPLTEEESGAVQDAARGEDEKTQVESDTPVQA